MNMFIRQLWEPLVMEITEKLKIIKILIVDDDETVRELSQSILNAVGFNNTWEAEDGQIALTLLKKQHFDIVICDWNMPNMTGLELLQQIRSINKLSNIAFLMATAISDAENVTKAIQEGVTDYVTKPFQPDILCNKVVTTYSKSIKQ